NTSPVTYETDFYSWALQQAQLLRARQLQELDVENLRTLSNTSS
ncbi:MAG: DUF29 family protein, partial [Nitrososphaerota archaeon]